MKIQQLQNAVEAFDFDINSDEHIPALGKLLADQQVVLVRQKLSQKRHYDIISSWGQPVKSKVIQAIVHRHILKGVHWNPIRRTLINCGVFIEPEHRDRMASVTFQKDKRGRALGIFTNGKLGWHSDMPAFKENMRMLGLASVNDTAGSQTTFLSTSEAYANLSQDDFTTVNELNTVFACHKDSLDEYGGDLIPEQKRFLRYSACPIDGLMAPLAAQTASGVGGIHFPGPWFDHFEGMSKQESKKYYNHIWSIINQPKYIYTHNWQDGEVMYFDSAITMHARPTNVEVNNNRTLWRCGGYLDKLYSDQGPIHKVTMEGEGDLSWDEYLRRIDAQRKQEYETEKD